MFKKLLFSLLFLTLSTTTTLAANLTLQVQNHRGLLMHSVPLTCYTKKPKVTAGPFPPPIITKLTTNSSGSASFTPETGDNYTYSCMVAYAITPDSCYSFQGTASGNFSLGSGESKTLNFTAIPTPETCGWKIPATETEAATHPWGTQSITPIWGDTPAPLKAGSATLQSSSSPSPTPSPTSPSSPSLAPSPSLSPAVAPSLPERVWERVSRFFTRIFNRLKN